MATLLQYKEIIQRNLVDTPESGESEIFPDDQITAAINSARCEWALRLGRTGDYLRTSATVNATTTAVTLPADFLGNLQVRFGTSGDRRILRPITKSVLDEKRPDWRDDSDTAPTHFYINNNADGTTTLQFYPALSAAVTNGLFYSYTAKPTALALDADDDKIMTWFPNLWMLAIPAYACVILLGFEGGTKDDQVSKWDAIFEAQVERARGILKYQAQHYPSYKVR